MFTTFGTSRQRGLILQDRCSLGLNLLRGDVLTVSIVGPEYIEAVIATLAAADSACPGGGEEGRQTNI